MNGSDLSTSAGPLHPLDVTPLIQSGAICSTPFHGRTHAVDWDGLDRLFERLGLKPVEQTVYMHFYRNAYGRGLNCAQLPTRVLCRLCSISHATARKAIRTLCSHGCLRQVRAGIQHDAPIYQVRLPREVLGLREPPPQSELPLRNIGQTGRALTFSELVALRESAPIAHDARPATAELTQE